MTSHGNIKISVLLAMTVFLLLSMHISAQEWSRIERLNGYWKFSIGDDPDWSLTDFDDSNWEDIRVPSSWENEGYHGYNGYAWYRKSFMIDDDINSSTIYLQLGYIDDVDEVYLNGQMIGSSGSFPPDFNTAYNAFRKYPIPASKLSISGKNVIAVRVYDTHLAGGIVSGDIGLYVKEYELQPDYSLEGEWKFHINDDKEWASPEFDDSEWTTINVPGLWEPQGYKDYNGFAWYRITFDVNRSLSDEKLVLLLGKIDDIDEAYLNGELIGATGNMYDDPFFISFSSEYSESRGYFIPQELLNSGTNVLAVRVYDGYIGGGIYEGPIGLITQSKYKKYWNSQKRKNLWEIIFGD
ncbi:MAG: beta galactosidase jelly roll domain-containing protein [Melioribacteraceae bacterium]|nr:beta galactosidase jelly roll domain-containing protein [Melioribacteraceae bacterium]